MCSLVPHSIIQIHHFKEERRKKEMRKKSLVELSIISITIAGKLGGCLTPTTNHPQVPQRRIPKLPHAHIRLRNELNIGLPMLPPNPLVAGADSESWNPASAAKTTSNAPSASLMAITRTISEQFQIAQPDSPAYKPLDLWVLPLPLGSGSRVCCLLDSNKPRTLLHRLDL